MIDRLLIDRINSFIQCEQQVLVSCLFRLLLILLVILNIICLFTIDLLDDLFVFGFLLIFLLGMFAYINDLSELILYVFSFYLLLFFMDKALRDESLLFHHLLFLWKQSILFPQIKEHCVLIVVLFSLSQLLH